MMTSDNILTPQHTKILDGKALARAVTERLSNQVKELVSSFGRQPGLAVILVGDNPASVTYVRNKERAAKKCGFYTEQHTLSADASEDDVVQVIKNLNQNPAIDGILLQLPVPKHLVADNLLAVIDPWKDADGLHSINQGYLIRGEAKRIGSPIPCTPAGAMKLLDYALSSHTIPQEVAKPKSLSGKNAVVVGRSILVGKPIALLLLERDATVTILHSKSSHPNEIAADADILVAASGVAGLITPAWVKEGAIVIDVGINRLASGVLVGDVDYKAVYGRCAAITPVPGGVGPMTVAMLLQNTFDLYRRRVQKKH
jgi:methylenetetrahydrofolate dehydrogenase (NADP+)/methenyltetrahydrofolate cyclohydrolase